MNITTAAHIFAAAVAAGDRDSIGYAAARGAFYGAVLEATEEGDIERARRRAFTAICGQVAQLRSEGHLYGAPELDAVARRAEALGIDFAQVRDAVAMAEWYPEG
jgi:hypothetical protein